MDLDELDRWEEDDVGRCAFDLLSELIVMDDKLYDRDATLDEFAGEDGAPDRLATSNANCAKSEPNAAY